MAKRKKAHKSKGRRRMGGTGKFNFASALTQVAGIAAGAVAANLLQTKFLPSMDGKLKGGLAIAAGVAVPMFVKSDLGKAIGAGMIAVGAVGTLREFGVMSGTDDQALLLPISVNGDVADLSVSGLTEETVGSYSGTMVAGMLDS